MGSIPAILEILKFIQRPFTSTKIPNYVVRSLFTAPYAKGYRKPSFLRPHAILRDRNPVQRKFTKATVAIRSVRRLGPFLAKALSPLSRFNHLRRVSASSSRRKNSKSTTSRLTSQYFNRRPGGRLPSFATGKLTPLPYRLPRQGSVDSHTFFKLKPLAVVLAVDTNSVNPLFLPLRTPTPTQFNNYTLI